MCTMWFLWCAWISLNLRYFNNHHIGFLPAITKPLPSLPAHFTTVTFAQLITLACFMHMHSSGTMMIHSQQDLDLYKYALITVSLEICVMNYYYLYKPYIYLLQLGPELTCGATQQGVKWGVIRLPSSTLAKPKSESFTGESYDKKKNGILIYVEIFKQLTEVPMHMLLYTYPPTSQITSTSNFSPGNKICSTIFVTTEAEQDTGVGN